jgi:hypothetical protein
MECRRPLDRSPQHGVAVICGEILAGRELRQHLCLLQDRERRLLMLVWRVAEFAEAAPEPCATLACAGARRQYVAGHVGRLRGVAREGR